MQLHEADDALAGSGLVGLGHDAELARRRQCEQRDRLFVFFLTSQRQGEVALDALHARAQLARLAQARLPFGESPRLHIGDAELLVAARVGRRGPRGDGSAADAAPSS